MDKHETNIKYNMGETCVESISIADILPESAQAEFAKLVINRKLTYGDIRGSPALKKGIAALYDDPEITPDNIVITNGAIGGNFLAFYTIVNPGDHVLVVEPSYQQLSSVPAMFGANVEPFVVKYEDNYLPDLDWLRSSILKNSTKLLVINNPNNPTGYVWENSILETIVEICKEHGTTLMCDEVYRPLFHDTEDVKSIVSFGYENTIASGSMSKAFSLAGLRLGWLATKNKVFLDGFWEKRDYNTISVLMIDDMMATVALQNHEKILQRNHELCQTNLDILDALVASSENRLQWNRPRGGSTCFIKVNREVDTMKMAEDLAENYGVLVVPGEVFKMPGWLRIGFGNKTDDVRGGADILDAWLAKN